MTTAAAVQSEKPSTPWWVFLIEGAALVILGILFLARTGMTTVVAIQILGLYWLIAGIVRIVSIFVDSSQWGWKLFFGVVGIIAGILVIQHPLWSSAIVLNTTVIILGFMGLFMGFVGIIQAFQGAGWGTGLLGVLSIIMGFVLLANRWWFSISLPTTFGVLSIIGGIVAIYWAFKARGEENMAPAPTPAPEPAPAAAAMAPVVEDTFTKDSAAAEEEPAAGDNVTDETPAAVEVIEVEEEEEEEKEEAEEEAKIAGMEAAALHGKLETIEGVGPEYSKKLMEAGIDSPGALLEKCATPKGRTELAEQTGISGKLILTWTNHADLFRISGVAGEYGELLEAAGVDTVPELAQRNPQNLHQALQKANQDKHLVRHIPSESQVESWVAQAKELPRVIQY